jgi:hypothetical protein
MVRRKIVARRLREFFAHLLTRFSGESAELWDRAEKRNTAPDPQSERQTEKPP